MKHLTTISRSEVVTLSAVELLDRALADYRRAERAAVGSTAGPLFSPELRWDMVRTARDLLASQSR